MLLVYHLHLINTRFTVIFVGFYGINKKKKYIYNNSYNNVITINLIEKLFCFEYSNPIFKCPCVYCLVLPLNYSVKTFANFLTQTV